MRHAFLLGSLILSVAAASAQVQIGPVPAPAGIGAVLITRDGAPVINEVMPHSPAAAAGLKPADMIVWVNYRDVAGMKLEDIVGLIRGDAGTPVAITVLHPGETKPQTYKMTREPIQFGFQGPE
jgi:C-terminal processing protease CtpA/Prc